MRLALTFLMAIACAGCTGKTDTPANRPGDRRVANSVVIIHGVGNQTAGYSKPIQDLLSAQHQSLHFVEVLWSDLGGVLRQAPQANDPERQAAEQQLLDEINAAEQRALASRTVLPSSGAPPDDNKIREEYAAARGFVGPIVRYEFLSPSERRRIQQRLRDALDWSAKNADRTFVIAHSLGSVIAFDTLHAWEGGGGTAPAKVALLATMGSPLGKKIFVSHLGRPTRRPGNADAWVNFHSPADPIASALAGPYADVLDRDIKTSILPLTAHGAYWTHGDVMSGLLEKLK
jgi:hypothetical protein